MLILAPLGLAALGAGGAWLLEPVTIAALPLNPAVSQDTIASTICVPGWTTTQRPSSHVTRRIAYDMLAQRGEPAANRPLYILDHEIPLQLGGAPSDLRNLELNTREDEKLKDRIEARLKCLVCAGRLALAEAQHAIWTDWRGAYQRWMSVQCSRPRRAAANG